MLGPDLFGVEKLNVNPEDSWSFLYAIGFVVVVGIGVIIFRFIKDHIEEKDNELQKRVDTQERIGLSKIGFDDFIPAIVRDIYTCKLPINSLEFYVCKLVFKNRNKKVMADDILDEADRNGFPDKKVVYDTVRRINVKAKKQLHLDDNLLECKKELVSLSPKYK